jgi:NifU-like protein involved in Fe-S cluster formation
VTTGTAADSYDDPYNQRVRELFASTAHAGTLANAVVVRNSDQGVRVELQAKAAAGRLAEIRYRVWGCPHSIAACEAVCAELEGAPVGQLLEYSIATLMQSLAVPAEKSARILVIEDTVRQLGAALQMSTESGRQD